MKILLKGGLIMAEFTQGISGIPFIAESSFEDFEKKTMG